MLLAFTLLLASVTTTPPLPRIPLATRGAVLRLAVTGDTGRGADAVAKGIARVHADQPIDAIVLAGDTFYPCGVTSEHDPRWSLVRPLGRIGVPIFPVLGNHDSCGHSVPEAQVRATGVEANWEFPATQYSVSSRLADITFLDTTSYVRGRTHLADVIRRSFASSAAPWRILVGHHPIVSSGFHGYFPRADVRKMQELVPALHDARVDLYICGHDHHLELIRGRTLLLVSGAGSEPVPPVKLHLHTVYPPEIGRERVGFAVVEVSERRIRVHFYDADGNARSGWIDGRTK